MHRGSTSLLMCGWCCSWRFATFGRGATCGSGGRVAGEEAEKCDAGGGAEEIFGWTWSAVAEF